MLASQRRRGLRLRLHRRNGFALPPRLVCTSIHAVSTTPEARAREVIDGQFAAAGWVVQDCADMNRTASLGLAVREYPLATGPCDYLLIVAGKACGVIEAKAAGTTLSGVAEQARGYQPQPQQMLARWSDPLRFDYEASGTGILFSDLSDPLHRSRRRDIEALRHFRAPRRREHIAGAVERHCGAHRLLGPSRPSRPAEGDGERRGAFARRPLDRDIKMRSIPISFRHPLILVVKSWAEEFAICDEQAELVQESEAAMIEAVEFDGDRLFLHLSSGSTCRVIVGGKQVSVGMQQPVPG